MVIRSRREPKKQKIPMHPRDPYRPTCTLAKIGVNGSRPTTPTSPLVRSEGCLVSNGNVCLRTRKNLMKIWLVEIKRGTKLKRQSTNEARKHVTCCVVIIIIYFLLSQPLTPPPLLFSFQRRNNVGLIMRSLNLLPQKV